MNLTNEDIRDILELLDSLPYDELHLRTDRFTLTLRRAADGGWTQETQVTTPPRAVDASPEDSTGSAVDGLATGPDSIGPVPAGEARSVAMAPADEVRRLDEVRAPLPGTFYRAPRPGAAPYVEVGDHVEDETVVGIVETMKLMNPVYAGARGTVVEIALANAQFAEQDAVLVRVELAGS